MTVNADQFKAGLRLWASGVTVITTHAEGQEPKGMTATSFTSVSLAPPQILVCLQQAADTAQAVHANQAFAVNILTQQQDTVSNLFAGGAGQSDRFAQVPWHSGTLGQPVLTESLATLECNVVDMVKAGTHWVVIGEVQAIQQGDDQPLLYYCGSYRNLDGPL
ncbi:MAG: flavin reductase family protein [Methylococcales bacterium]|nr:flavin reductase family protein [Methylococcales bacterium]